LCKRGDGKGEKGEGGLAGRKGAVKGTEPSREVY
jgi:hypothetical protein